LVPAPHGRCTSVANIRAEIADLGREGSGERVVNERINSSRNVAIARAKEETAYWLELLVGTRIVTVEKLGPLQQECDELTATFVAILKRAKTSSFFLRPSSFRPLLLLPRCRKAERGSDSLTKSDPFRAARNKRNKQ
jgi:hypothetical protein